MNQIYSFYGMNVHNKMYIKYYTEASQLPDELVGYFRDNTGDITVQ